MTPPSTTANGAENVDNADTVENASAAQRSGPAGAGPPVIPTRAAVRVLVTQAVLALVVGLAFLLCYAGLQSNPQPRRLPIAVVGDRTAAQVSHALGPAVAVTTVATDQDARNAVVEHRTVAAMSPRHADLTLYLAAPNGFAENTAAEDLAKGYAHAAHLSLATTTVVATVPGDPRGINAFYLALAVTVASFILSQAMYAVRTLIRVRAQIVTMTAFAAGIATLTAVIAAPVLHLIPAGALSLAAVLTVLSLAVSLSARALTAWCGPIGITIATLAMTAVGLSTSGGILGPNLLPAPLAVLGSVLPPGLGLRAIVSTAYFAGHGALAPVFGLAVWAVAGVSLLLAHRTDSARRASSPRMRRAQRTTTKAASVTTATVRPTPIP